MDGGDDDDDAFRDVVVIGTGSKSVSCSVSYNDSPTRMASSNNEMIFDFSKVEPDDDDDAVDDRVVRRCSRRYPPTRGIDVADDLFNTNG